MCDVRQEAVMLPCCHSSTCDACARAGILSSNPNRCPIKDCRQSVVVDQLIPNISMRKVVESFLRSRAAKGRDAQQMPVPVITAEDVMEGLCALPHVRLFLARTHAHTRTQHTAISQLLLLLLFLLLSLQLTAALCVYVCRSSHACNGQWQRGIWQQGDGRRGSGTQGSEHRQRRLYESVRDRKGQ
jgi:hypothetical protein